MCVDADSSDCVQLEARMAATRQAADEADQKRLHMEQQLHSLKPQVSSYHNITPYSASTSASL